MLAQNAKDLHIKGSVIASGRPGFGIAGTPGKPGVDGKEGQDGKDGVLCFNKATRRYNPQPESGLGGKQPACEEADGGSGGTPGGYFRAGLFGTPELKVAQPGEAGEGAGAGSGGAAGTMVKVPVPDGLMGSDGEPAKQAVGGLAQGSWEAQGSQLVWVYQGDGGDGNVGGAGSGGGGGGQTLYENNSYYSWGPTGGGGGSGGCAGSAGGGGKAGGSSFGIVLYESSLTLSSTKVQAALGGVGGQGVSGGAGGQGGFWRRSGTYDTLSQHRNRHDPNDVLLKLSRQQVREARVGAGLRDQLGLGEREEQVWQCTAHRCPHWLQTSLLNSSQMARRPVADQQEACRDLQDSPAYLKGVNKLDSYFNCHAHSPQAPLLVLICRPVALGPSSLPSKDKPFTLTHARFNSAGVSHVHSQKEGRSHDAFVSKNAAPLAAFPALLCLSDAIYGRVFR